MNDRKDSRERIFNMFEALDRYFTRLQLVAIYNDHDIHAYYKLSLEPSRVIHVQGYPGMSSESEARVWARMMDHERMVEARRRGVSRGNEHGATTQDFPNFESGIMIPYDPEILGNKLAENVPEIRRKYME